MSFLRRTVPALFIATGLLAGATASLASTLDNITVLAAPAGQPSKVTVNAKDGDDSVCGLRVQFGDGQMNLEKVGSRSHEGFPRTFEHTYAKPGTYRVQADGKRKAMYLPCQGEVETTITIPGGKTGTAGAPASPCPEGWAAQGKAKKDGSFICGPAKGVKNPAKPAQPLNCPAGTGYFTKGKTLGCEAAQ